MENDARIIFQYVRRTNGSVSYMFHAVRDFRDLKKEDAGVIRWMETGVFEVFLLPI